MTSIEWCQNPDGSKGKSWNPIRARNIKTGRVGHYCEHVTDACRFCYAEWLNLNTRNLPFGGTGLPFKPGHLADVEIYLDEEKLLEPLSWRTPQRVFVDSMDDPFGHWVRPEWLDKIFAVMALRPDHTFILLTKRPERAREYLAARNGVGDAHLCRAINEIPFQLGNRRGSLQMPLPNVWLLASCGNQEDVDRFAPIVLDTPAAVRGLSLEPLLGPVDLKRWMPSGTWGSFQGAPVYHQTYFMTKCEHCGWLGSSELVHLNSYGDDADCVCPGCHKIFMCDDFGDGRGVRWVITGGESGSRDQAVRPVHPRWEESLRSQCKAASVPYFRKQWGEYRVIWERRADPDDRRVPAVHNVADRRFLNWAGGHGFHGEDVVAVERVGKARAGHLLDGVAHQEWPEVAS